MRAIKTLIDQAVDVWPSDWAIFWVYVITHFTSPVLAYAITIMLSVYLGIDLSVSGFLVVYFITLLALFPLINLLMLLFFWGIESWRYK